jgi:hypothetical protein
MATATTWATIVTAIGSVVETLAIVVGGAFAYMKFARGRVLHARVDLDLQARELEVDGAHALLIAATVTNAGTLRITFPANVSQRLVLTLADSILWRDACNATHPEMLWTEGIHCYDQDILVVEGRREVNPDPKDPNPFLEPGERLRRTLLVPMPEDELVAYRVSLTVTARPRLIWRTGRADSWKTELVAAKGQSDGGPTNTGIQ